jgi:hypothetical protein
LYVLIILDPLRRAFRAPKSYPGNPLFIRVRNEAHAKLIPVRSIIEVATICLEAGEQANQVECSVSPERETSVQHSVGGASCPDHRLPVKLCQGKFNDPAYLVWFNPDSGSNVIEHGSVTHVGNLPSTAARTSGPILHDPHAQQKV